MLHMDRHDGHPSQLQSKAKLPERTQQDTELPNLVMDDPIGSTLKASLMQSLAKDLGGQHHRRDQH